MKTMSRRRRRRMATSSARPDEEPLDVAARFLSQIPEFSWWPSRREPSQCPPHLQVAVLPHSSQPADPQRHLHLDLPPSPPPPPSPPTPSPRMSPLPSSTSYHCSADPYPDHSLCRPPGSPRHAPPP